MTPAVVMIVSVPWWVIKTWLEGIPIALATLVLVLAMGEARERARGAERERVGDNLTGWVGILLAAVFWPAVGVLSVLITVHQALSNLFTWWLLRREARRRARLAAQREAQMADELRAAQMAAGFTDGNPPDPDAYYADPPAGPPA